MDALDEMLGMTLADTAGVLLAATLADGDELVESEAETDTEASSERDGVPDELSAALDVTEGVASRDADPDCVGVPVALGEVLGVKLVDAAIVLLGVSLKDSDELVETDADTDGEAGVESDGVLDALPALLGETEAVAG